jgi:hypothetical protein
VSNPVAPVREITIKGTTYKLKFSFEAVAEAEDLTGQALLAGTFMSEPPRINRVRAMFYASLHTFQPTLTVEEVTKMVTKNNFIEVWAVTMKSWGDGMGEPDPEDSAEGEAPAQS